MTRRRWVVATVGLILAALVIAVWVVPTVRGPWVDCDPSMSSEDCERSWRSLAEFYAPGGQALFPITNAKVERCYAEVYILYFWPAATSEC